ncbi:MAG: ABC transporter permease, partial [Arcobacteraceae bacterium]
MRVLLKKISYIALMLLLISIISFSVIQLAPNSFFASGELNPNITPETIANLKAIYGLDKPLHIQFFSWLSSILVLDFGVSFSSGEMVKDMILEKLPITLV